MTGLLLQGQTSLKQLHKKYSETDRQVFWTLLLKGFIIGAILL